jgi:hypothetical protein
MKLKLVLAAAAAALSLGAAPAFAFNPQPDPPGRPAVGGNYMQPSAKGIGNCCNRRHVSVGGRVQNVQSVR